MLQQDEFFFNHGNKSRSVDIELEIICFLKNLGVVSIGGIMFYKIGIVIQPCSGMYEHMCRPRNQTR